MNIQQKAIEYIPHQEPMVFIDDLVEIGFELTDALPVQDGTRNAQGVVALRCDKPIGAVAGDQCAVEKCVQHLLACAAFDVVGKPVDLAASVL